MIILDTLELDNFVWLNEFDAVHVTEQNERALNGAQHIEKTAINTGHVIQLYSNLESADVFNPIFEHAKTTLTSFVLVIRDVQHNVTWSHKNKPIDVKPLSLYNDAAPTHFENITLNLRTV